MRYPFQIESDGNFFLVTFPDVPEAITQGDSFEEAERMAYDALATALDFYLGAKMAFPTPSQIRSGQHFVEISPTHLAKSALHLYLHALHDAFGA